jgi:hypothetical protein
VDDDPIPTAAELRALADADPDQDDRDLRRLRTSFAAHARARASARLMTFTLSRTTRPEAASRFVAELGAQGYVVAGQGVPGARLTISWAAQP